MLAHVKERTRLDNLDTQVLMQPSQFGRRDGSNLHVALLGRPNAGTSTLFNALAGRRTSASPFLGETRRVNRGRSEHRTPEFEWLCQLYMPATGQDRVIQRRFNVSVPRARVSETAPTLRKRSER